MMKSTDLDYCDVAILPQLNSEQLALNKMVADCMFSTDTKLRQPCEIGASAATNKLHQTLIMFCLLLGLNYESSIVYLRLIST